MNIRLGAVALSAIFLGIGILLACFLPAAALVIIVCIAIIAVGCCCLKR
ncbi:MAG TPA: hypothetical protein VHO66_04980 [Ruminiclostridium sp.]|nr:hypothetical protein [Ruminiclostridium sp.]